ncbi:MAG: PEP-CTERM sorting domain-containing protein [Synechococcales cyanobacterium RM1_1_8]|nr:PEP-CTERM sorting domain-containing protein [Synechococcales cyanobacterium RM1_1_8]
MKTINLKQSLQSTVLITAALGCIVSAPQAAQAGQQHGGWTYAIDSFNDGTEGRVIGDKSAFEFYGLAYREYEDTVVFAFNSNLDLNGYSDRRARGGNIGYGDLFLNFGSGNFSQADGTGDLYAVNFANNDSKVAQGLYRNVTTQSLTTQNSGYSSIKQHTQTVASYKGTASHGDLAANDGYFDQNKAARTNIKRGDYASSIAMLDSFEDLDFGHFGASGKKTFGFSINKSSLPLGDFVANFFAECGNDGIAIKGELTGKVATIPGSNDTKAVPESSSTAGLLVIGMMAGTAALRKRRQAAAVVAAQVAA